MSQRAMEHHSAYQAKATQTQIAPVTQKPRPAHQRIANLAVPVSIPYERRLSPRAEDLALKARKPAKADETRKRLDEYRSFDDAVGLLSSSNNIVVLTGAGISTSVGIPDFRSDTGLYEQLSRDLGMTTPEEFFEIEFFTREAAQFFRYVKRVIPDSVAMGDGTYISTKPGKSKDNPTQVPRFSPTHAFLSFLQAKGKLLTNYTQNIDGLEVAAGLDPSKFIQCHGSWDSATCLSPDCRKTSKAKKYLPVILSGNVPCCKCSLAPPPKSKKRKRRNIKPGSKRKRLEEWEDSEHSSDNAPSFPRGLLKPDITFFGDSINDKYDARLTSDKPKIDLLIIIGTSLKVAPVQKMLVEIDSKTPQIYISKERFSGALCSLPGVQVDIELLGEADLIIEELCRRAGWLKELERWLWMPGMMKINGKGTVKNSLQQTKQTVGEDPEEPRFPLTSKIKTEDGDLRIRNNTRPQRKLSEQNYAFRYKSENNAATNIAPQDMSTTESSTANNTIQTPIKDENKGDITESKVKVELVEGTTHQWRVTRKK